MADDASLGIIFCVTIWETNKMKYVTMKRTLTSSVWKEGDWFVAQCIEVDIASQGETPELALVNLKEALEQHFEPPHHTSILKPNHQ
jgi:predicted RNase H-like HicB family nuclease